MFDLAEIDNGIYEAIRLVLVQYGYLPDVLTANTIEAWKSAQQGIVNSGKEVIKLFGVGNYKDRQALTNNKIIIDRTDMRLGRIGGKQTFFKETAPDVFDEYAYPEHSTDIDYQVTYVCSSAKYDVLLYQFIKLALHEKGYLKGLKADGTATEGTFHFALDDVKDNSDGEYIERVFRLTVNDVFVGLPRKVAEGVTTVKQINIEIKPAKDSLENAKTEDILTINF